jgi:hypothetical protein
MILKVANPRTVSFSNSDFSEWNKKTPEDCPQEFIYWELGINLLRSSVSLAYGIPVDHIPESGNVVWASILVV